MNTKNFQILKYHMEKKLFYIVDNGDSSLTIKPEDLLFILRNGFEDWNIDTPTDELPVFTVSPVYMTQEEYNNIPEYNG